MFIKINTMSVVTNSQRSSFVLENYFVNRLPHISIIRPVRSPYLEFNTFEQVIDDLVKVLNRGLYNLVLNSTSLDQFQILNKVGYYLYPTVPGGDSSILENIRQNTSLEGPILAGANSYFKIGEVTMTKISHILNNKINQSGRKYTIKDLEWHVLFSPLTLIAGSGLKIKTTIFIGIYKECWENHYYQDFKINCAAFALSRLINYNRNDTIDKRIKKAYDLQRSLEWGDSVSMIDFLYFLKLYPKYRVTIMYWRTIKQGARNFEGAAYKLMSKHDQSKHWLYITYDFITNHFAPCSPTKFYQVGFNCNDYKFCDWCVTGFLGSHTCDDNHVEKKIYKSTKCECGQYGTHNDCSMYKCTYCKTDRKKGDYNHRCIITGKEVTHFFNKDLENKSKSEKDAYGLWVYDLESRINIVQGEVERINSFGTTDGKFNNIKTFSKNIYKHEVNLAVIKNVFTNEEKYFKGDTAVEDMYAFISQHNYGRNIVIAHNASGYDSRLVFEKLMNTGKKPSVIFRGSKIIRVTFNDTCIFIDSMLHVQGSLRKLAKEYGYTNIRKGHFPHLFNSVENYGYKGPIPGKEFFDLPFMFKDQKELEEFDIWYDSWYGKLWDFDKELLDYCIDDVRILQAVVKGYHENAVRLTQGLSPWFFSTAPAFCHNFVLTTLVKRLNLSETPERSQIENLAKNEFWAALIQPEYYFARKALRGGRTEIRNIYHVVSDEDWNRGVRIRYQDICSEYPFQQIVHDFPVGTPTINVWDLDYKPCIFHRNRYKCDCIDKLDFVPLDIIIRDDQLNINEHSFFGIVCVTLRAPKDLFHPVLVCMDLERSKCVASLEDNHLKEITCTSVELQTAIRKGYQIIKVHRYDQYTRKKSLWYDLMLKFFIEKMINAGSVPENIEELIFNYQEKYGVGHEIRKAVEEGRFQNNPGLKQTAKIMINSMWGKHAQRPDLTKTLVYDNDKDEKEITNFFVNLQKGVFDLKSADYLGNDNVMYKFLDTEEKILIYTTGIFLLLCLFLLTVDFNYGNN